MTNQHIFNPTILREYDIRGELEKSLNIEDAIALGHSFASFVRSKNPNNESLSICIGYDGRHSSPDLANALSTALQNSGIHVKWIGLGPTPMLYFSVKHLKADAGIMVTGSHNPPQYNGFKMMLQNEAVFGDSIQELGRIAKEGKFGRGSGSQENLDIRQDYIARLLKDLRTNKPFKLAWDAGNGAAGEIMDMLCNKLPGEHIRLFKDIDGSFPNHHPDPTVDENMQDLIKTVKENGCDFGIGFDGDGDRIGVVDNNGDILRCDVLMALYAREILEDMPGSPIVGDIKCSQVMFEEIKNMGGQPIMWKTGHSLIKDKMRELNAPLGGELSGHIFFADKYYGFDDALYCAIRLMNIVAESGKSLADLTAPFKGLHSTQEVRFEVDESEKFDLVPRVYQNLKAQNDNNFEINDIDGVRVSTIDGWWLLRPSNTQSVLVARAEGKSKEGLQRLINFSQEQVRAIGYELDFS